MDVRKVAAASVLAAGLGVAGLVGAGAASADNTDNPTTNDSNGYGITNHMKNGFTEDGPTFNNDLNGIGHIRSTQTGAEVSADRGVRGRDADVNGIVTHQGSPTEPADFGPISNAGGKKK
jgi:hypothetical protein